MKNYTILVFLISFSLAAPSLAQNASEVKQKYILAPTSSIVPMYETVISDTHYRIAVDDYVKRLYISCNDPNFKIDGKPVIDRPLSSFKNKDEAKLIMGWGHYLMMDDNWYAAFDFKDLNDDSKVWSVFQYDMGKDQKKLEQGKKERLQNSYQRMMVSVPREGEYMISHAAEIDGIKYDIAVDNILKSLYVQTSDPDFKLDGKAIIGQPLSSFENRQNVRYMSNWGNYLKLDDHWYAMLGKQYGIDDDAKVLFVFQYDMEREENKLQQIRKENLERLKSSSR
ncbi:hypothetical protein EDD80_105215 [Anseongella ginsenosidimutans]|uniref:DKNYY family protein n=1 Tax=Anseongella ginsenosidimutans TaxID=496056 RepID=A0A4R3KR54_9SPHI|nr:hypothetical protein [Anseongella ginsenosidimutans]QEC52994.1 hypothetical protein FRZ59_12060 [Anseongella ginsenosidimutans]TCS87400.1 hypothetical protein EDD80_105215 [Anseongella ginsenosidimutans]